MRRVSPATVMSALALFFSLGGVGIAASGYRITSIWQIKPSVRHALRGERGPQGFPGPQGIQGPSGAAGPSIPIDWRNNMHWSPDYILDSDHSTVTPTAYCPSGQQAITGGFRADPVTIVTDSAPVLAPLPPNATGSTPQPAIGWTATVRLAPSALPNQHSQAWVVCG